MTKHKLIYVKHKILLHGSVLNGYDVDTAYNNFMSLFIKQFDITCPFSKIKIKINLMKNLD